jgi:hypothetical protein
MPFLDSLPISADEPVKGRTIPIFTSAAAAGVAMDKTIANRPSKKTVTFFMISSLKFIY